MNRMPTRNDAVAKGPSEAGKTLPSESVAFGRLQFTRKWRVFAGQFSQPQLMKLAVSVLGEQALHSSQIHGFSSGKLRDPAPKVLLAIGLLNLAIARSNGAKDAGEGTRCPQNLAPLWENKKWLLDDTGAPMGPVEIFLAVTGQIDLNTDGSIEISPDHQAAVSKSLGKYARTKLMEASIDFMDGEEMAGLMEICPIIEDLIYGREVNAALLTAHLPDLAMACEVDLEEIVDFAVSPIIRH